MTRTWLRSLRGTFRYQLFAALTATSALLATMLMPTAAGAGQTPRVLPTVVLVHGAFADSSGWNKDIIELRRDGYPVVAVSDPLRGLSSDADYVRSVLATIPGPVILVGHSYGGAVITNAARGADNVTALVYVGAFVPDEGESVATVLDPTTYPGSLLGPDTTFVRPYPDPTADGGVGLDIYIKPEDFRRVFAADVPKRTADLMAITQRPLSLAANNGASGPPAWRSIPSWALITLRDKAIPPAGQQFMATRAGAHITTVRSSHAVMVSHPDAVVAVIRAADAGTSTATHRSRKVSP
jgi:pimeloyl-ACP methyl ester carboxylesterase